MVLLPQLTDWKVIPPILDLCCYCCRQLIIADYYSKIPQVNKSRVWFARLLNIGVCVITVVYATYFIALVKHNPMIHTIKLFLPH